MIEIIRDGIAETMSKKIRDGEIEVKDEMLCAFIFTSIASAECSKLIATVIAKQFSLDTEEVASFIGEIYSIGDNELHGDDSDE